MKKRLGVLSRRVTIALLAILLGLTSIVPVSAAEPRYLPLDVVSGSNPDVELEINSKSQSLDLTKTDNIRVRVKIN